MEQLVTQLVSRIEALEEQVSRNKEQDSRIEEQNNRIKEQDSRIEEQNNHIKALEEALNSLAERLGDRGEPPSNIVVDALRGLGGHCDAGRAVFGDAGGEAAREPWRALGGAVSSCKGGACLQHGAQGR